MKTLQTVLACLASLAFLEMPERGFAQTYQQITPDFALSLGVNDQSASPSIGISGNMVNNITIDPINQTIRQQGSIYLPATTGTFTFHESRVIPGTPGSPGIPAIFPNPPVPPTPDGPPQTIFGDITLTLSYDGGNISFDTLAQPFAFKKGTAWSFNPNGASTILNLPLNISYSLTTGGQTSNGNLIDHLAVILTLDTEFDSSNYPASITLRGQSAGFEKGTVTIIDLTAPNGFSEQIIGPVPEPSTLALGIMGAAAILSFARSKRS